MESEREAGSLTDFSEERATRVGLAVSSVLQQELTIGRERRPELSTANWA